MPAYLSTDHIAKGERAAYWTYLVSQVLGRLETEPANEFPFQRGD